MGFRRFTFTIIALLLLAIVAAWILNFSTTEKDSDPSSKDYPLSSFYENKEDYEVSFSKVSNLTKEQVLAGITSHHFLAKDLIANFFLGINPEGIENVFIVGPDHYSALNGSEIYAATTRLNWETPYGRYKPNARVISALLGIEGFGENDLVFRREHSIYTLVPFAKKAFPNAKIIPIVLKNSKDYQMFYDLGGRAFRKNSLLIASIDFSHVATEETAYQNDLESIRALVSADLENLGSIEADCRQCVAFLYGFLSGTPSRFKLIENKDSSDYGSTEENNLTSYVSGYFVNDNIRILFGGDLMFDRYIRQVAQNKGNDFILKNTIKYLLDKDLVVVNLEGPVTTFESISVGSKIGAPDNFVFTFPPAVADVLATHNIKLVNIGNNHILNFGWEGLNQTKKFLLDKNISFFGNTGTPNDQTRFKTVEIKGKKIAFVNYNQFTAGSVEAVLEDLNQVKDGTDFIIIYTHWGDEYSNEIRQPFRDLAHKLIDSGADLIIGSHPHVVQEKEIYNGKTIYYSLGNLVFDQYFSEETKKGLMVELNIDLSDGSTGLLEHYINLDEGGQTLW
ncbi:AmmeMemoRadiSam system protein B [candidate division WWE3 bacterium RIFCSPHIGHO2_01_FULL_42_13]|uniref:AmmeMemoRadiSam system protein B n=1 Tax=candidate division WWE3 bacterium RIFCSPHIGHO2_01_FULL_42_13 TaxID=1802617 RepID=A0A1F4US58_UNCKA|nr:MAG: AmmeMemoRadiSam system protein B [candidate division WWE3 bacterium RIFCSPHIGHO2_01_FULL_42_13]